MTNIVEQDKHRSKSFPADNIRPSYKEETVPKVCNLKKGNIVSINDHPYRVTQIDVHSPSARGANTVYKVRMYEVASGQKRDDSFKGNDYLEEMELDRRPVSFIFREQTHFTFMDAENYEQYTLSEESLTEQLQWLSEGLEGITALLLNGNIIAVELPATMEFEITETAPAIKGASVTNRTKPAVLSNGYTVMVPEYIPTGVVVKINTETGKFMSRVKS